MFSLEAGASCLAQGEGAHWSYKLQFQGSSHLELVGLLPEPVDSDYLLQGLWHFVMGPDGLILSKLELTAFEMSYNDLLEPIQIEALRWELQAAFTIRKSEELMVSFTEEVSGAARNVIKSLLSHWHHQDPCTLAETLKQTEKDLAGLVSVSYRQQGDIQIKTKRELASPQMQRQRGAIPYVRDISGQIELRFAGGFMSKLEGGYSSRFHLGNKEIGQDTFSLELALNPDPTEVFADFLAYPTGPFEDLRENDHDLIYKTTLRFKDPAALAREFVASTTTGTRDYWNSHYSEIKALIALHPAHREELCTAWKLSTANSPAFGVLTRAFIVVGNASAQQCIMRVFELTKTGEAGRRHIIMSLLNLENPETELLAWLWQVFRSDDSDFLRSAAGSVLSALARNLRYSQAEVSAEITQQFHHLYEHAGDLERAYFLMLIGNAGHDSSYPLLAMLTNQIDDPARLALVIRALRYINLPEAKLLCKKFQNIAHPLVVQEAENCLAETQNN